MNSTLNCGQKVRIEMILRRQTLMREGNVVDTFQIVSHERANVHGIFSYLHLHEYDSYHITASNASPYFKHISHSESKKDYKP